MSAVARARVSSRSARAARARYVYMCVYIYIYIYIFGVVRSSSGCSTCVSFLACLPLDSKAKKRLRENRAIIHSKENNTRSIAIPSWIWSLFWGVLGYSRNKAAASAGCAAGCCWVWKRSWRVGRIYCAGARHLCDNCRLAASPNCKHPQSNSRLGGSRLESALLRIMAADLYVGVEGDIRNCACKRRLLCLRVETSVRNRTEKFPDRPNPSPRKKVIQISLYNETIRNTFLKVLFKCF